MRAEAKFTLVMPNGSNFKEVKIAAKDLETTYVRDVVIDYPENYNNTYVEVENVTIQSNGYVESEFVKSAILRLSVVVEEGGYLYVYPW